jgi:hypothetical protein
MPSLIISADFNGDGTADLVTANDSSKDISVLLNCTPTPTCVASVTDSLFNISPLNWGITPHYSSQVTSAVWHWGDGSSTNGLYPSHTYTVAGLYNICVTVYTSCGDSANTCRNDSIYRVANNSSMVYINVVHNTTGVNQLSLNINKLIIYPNPSSNNITIQSATELGVISIYNALGEKVKETRTKMQEPRVEIDISNLPAGIYTVQAQGRFMKLVKE